MRPFQGRASDLQLSRYRRRLSQQAGRHIVKSQLCVDPTLPLWHQPIVHKAGLRCLAAVVSSFLAAQLVSSLLQKASKKASIFVSS